MAEYIERESMIKHLDCLYDRMYAKTPQFYAGFMIARDFVNDFLAADVAPVVHGQWTEDEATCPGPGLANYKCSVCGEIGGSWRQGLPPEKLLRYCPWCGAKMEGENEPD